MAPASSAMPVLIAEVGFTAAGVTTDLILDDPVYGKLDTATLRGSFTFVDLKQYVRAASIKRGSSRVQGPLIRYEAGTATTVLRNEDRRFDPTNLSGPYVSAGKTEVEPMRPVRFRATWAGTTYDVWRGFADSWGLSYTKKGNYSEAVLNSTDGFKVLAASERSETDLQGGGEHAGARVNRILDSADWSPTDRAVATGDVDVQGTTLAGDALSELLLVADTEIGEVYIDAAGRLVFRNRNAILTELRSTNPQATFGDVAGELPYDDVAVEYDEAQLVNEALITRANGTEQTAVDGTSKADYLTHAFSRSGLLMDNDAAALDYARWTVFFGKDPELRFAELTIKPQRDPNNLFPQVLGREIGDRIKITLRPPGGGVITRDVFIRGISHDITRTTWETKWTLQSATKFSGFLILDDATRGTLNASNTLAP